MNTIDYVPKIKNFVMNNAKVFFIFLFILYYSLLEYSRFSRNNLILGWDTGGHYTIAEWIKFKETIPQFLPYSGGTETMLYPPIAHLCSSILSILTGVDTFYIFQFVPAFFIGLICLNLFIYKQGHKRMVTIFIVSILLLAYLHIFILSVVSFYHEIYSLVVLTTAILLIMKFRLNVASSILLAVAAIATPRLLVFVIPFYVFLVFSFCFTKQLSLKKSLFNVLFFILVFALIFNYPISHTVSKTISPSDNSNYISISQNQSQVESSSFVQIVNQLIGMMDRIYTIIINEKAYNYIVNSFKDVKIAYNMYGILIFMLPLSAYIIIKDKNVIYIGLIIALFIAVDMYILTGERISRLYKYIALLSFYLAYESLYLLFQNLDRFKIKQRFNFRNIMIFCLIVNLILSVTLLSNSTFGGLWISNDIIKGAKWIKENTSPDARIAYNVESNYLFFPGLSHRVVVQGNYAGNRMGKDIYDALYGYKYKDINTSKSVIEKYSIDYIIYVIHRNWDKNYYNRIKGMNLTEVAYENEDVVIVRVKKND